MLKPTTCDTLDSTIQDIKKEKNKLVVFANATFSESKELCSKLRCLTDNEPELSQIYKKLGWHLMSLAAVNRFLKLRSQDEDEWHKELQPPEFAGSPVGRGRNTMTSLLTPFPVTLQVYRTMRVSCFKSSTDFWLQLASHVWRETLSSILSEKYNNKFLTEYPNPKPGDAVVVSTPLGIIRALILHTSKSCGLEVLDLDSGQELHATGKAFILDPDLLDAHQQAVHCALCKDDPLFFESESILRRALCSGNLTVTFVDHLPAKYTARYMVIVKPKSFDEKATQNKPPQFAKVRKVKSLPADLTELTSKQQLPPPSSPGLKDQIERKEKGKEKVSRPDLLAPKQEPISLHHPKMIPEIQISGIEEVQKGPDCDDDVISIGSVSSVNYSRLLKAGDEVDVLVSHVVSPNKIYVHVINEETASMDSMHDSMRLVYSHPSRPDFNAQVGDMIALYSKTDRLWIRGNLLNIQHHDEEEGEDQLTVHLTDFGDTICVPESACANLVPAFKQLSPLARCFSLAQVFPVSPLKRWSSLVKEELRALLLTSEVMRLYVVASADEATPVPTVVLVMKNAGEEVVVNELLVREGLASSKFIGKKERELSLDELEENKAMDAWDPMGEDFRTGYMDDGNVNQAVTGYNPTDEKRVCYLFSKTGKCDRGGCRKEHIKLNPDGWTTDKEEIFMQAFNDLKLPTPGSTCCFRVTEAICENNMFGIITENLQNNCDGHGNIEELVEYMNMSLYRTERLRTWPSVGQLVLARDCQRDKLYRARVAELRDHPAMQEVFVKVFYVDYGTTEWTELQNLRNIVPQFLHLPFQAVEFRVEDLQAKPNCTPAAMERIMDLVEEREVAAEVISSHPGQNQIWTVWIRNTFIGGRPLRSILEGLVLNPGEKVLNHGEEVIHPAADAVVIPG